jgi:nucleoside-diphosphate-sugar epimerase
MESSVLLTGATGALGPHLCAMLLGEHPDCALEALVRPGTHPLRRFGALRQATLEALGTDRAGFVDRLHLLHGDITRPGLGLHDDRALRSSVSCIVHAAADTRFRGPAADQWEVNVGGTRNVLDFAASCPNLRRLVLVSTICVAGNRTGSIPESELSRPDAFVNHYEQTKWEAERLCLASRLPVIVVRVSVVAGSRRSGIVHRLGAFHHAVRWVGEGLIPMIPGASGSTLDLISAEYAAGAVARVSALPGASGIYHAAAGERHAPLPELVDFVTEAFRPLREGVESRAERPSCVEWARFQQYRAQAGSRRDRVIGQMLESADTFLPGLRYPKLIRTDRMRQVLPLAESEDWRCTLRKVIDRMFLPRAARSARSMRRTG